MDIILQSLQGRAFHLTDGVYHFLSDKYEFLIADSIPDLPLPGGRSRLHAGMIEAHRKQFLSEEYINDRIAHSASGTIDHLHAEVTATLAAEFGRTEGYPAYAVELLRLAGHMHDSERSFPHTMVRGEEKVRKDPILYREFKKVHARQSAEMVRLVAEACGIDDSPEHKEFIQDTRYLVTRHEIGGPRDDDGKAVPTPSAVYPHIDLGALADLLRDADSLAYFYANILTNWEECGRDIESLNNKIHFMYDRMGQTARGELQKRVLNSPDHILGKPNPGDSDLRTIREAMVGICE